MAGGDSRAVGPVLQQEYRTAHFLCCHKPISLGPAPPPLPKSLQAVCLVQALAAPAADAIPAPRPVAAALQAARSLPQRLHHTASGLGMAGRRVLRAAVNGARRLRSTLAAAACMSLHSSAAAA